MHKQNKKSQKHNTFCVAIAPAQQACIEVVYELPSRITVLTKSQ